MNNTVEIKRKELRIITVEDRHTFYMYSPPIEKCDPHYCTDSDVVFTPEGNYVGNYWTFVGDLNYNTYLAKLLINEGKTVEEALDIAEEIVKQIK